MRPQSKANSARSETNLTAPEIEPKQAAGPYGPAVYVCVKFRRLTFDGDARLKGKCDHEPTSGYDRLNVG